jgi:hypothetical protein
MNDNLLIARVLREIVTAASYADEAINLVEWISFFRSELAKRAAELDPPEKNEKPQ